MNPYETPGTAAVDAPPAPFKRKEMSKAFRSALDFVSFSGSFSRAELLVATLSLAFLTITISAIHESFPTLISQSASIVLKYSLYPIWGAALGKRSRDLGTTFTYGMIVGMIFPILGLIFLFQPGTKARHKSQKTPEQAVARNRSLPTSLNSTSSVRGSED
ncbi:MAG: hypothetical protein V4819_24810 [Verrucomicrobiota bacterium]